MEAEDEVVAEVLLLVREVELEVEEDEEKIDEVGEDCDGVVAVLEVVPLLEEAEDELDCRT